MACLAVRFEIPLVIQYACRNYYLCNCAKSYTYPLQVVHIEEISARIGKYVEIPCMLSENIKAALKRAGITRLYSHQVTLFSLEL